MGAELGLPPGLVDLNTIHTRGTPMDPGGTAAATAAREDIGRELADLGALRARLHAA